VEDEAGEKVFHIDGKVLRPRSTFVIETADGQELLKVKEQRLKLRKTYAIERGGEEIAKVAKALVNPLRDRFDVEVAGGAPSRPRAICSTTSSPSSGRAACRWPRSPSAGSPSATPTGSRSADAGRGARDRDRGVHRRHRARPVAARAGCCKLRPTPV
jgi:hypothetical protein